VWGPRPAAWLGKAPKHTMKPHKQGVPVPPTPRPTSSPTFSPTPTPEQSTNRCVKAALALRGNIQVTVQGRSPAGARVSLACPRTYALVGPRVANCSFSGGSGVAWTMLPKCLCTYQ
jgi:hypothetical protein